MRPTYQGATKTALRGKARMEVNERDTDVCCRTEAFIAVAAGASRQIVGHSREHPPSQRLALLSSASGPSPKDGVAAQRRLTNGFGPREGAPATNRRV